MKGEHVMDDEQERQEPVDSPYSQENHRGRTMQQVRLPWTDYDGSCETWGPGSFHPMSPTGLFKPVSHMVEDKLKRVDANLTNIADEQLTPKFREQARRNIEISMSHIAQLLDISESIPRAAGDSYRAWVKTWVEKQPQMTLSEREDLIFRWREKTGQWPAFQCPQCQRQGFERIGSSACCRSYNHHLGECCLHCGNDERDPEDRKEMS